MGSAILPAWELPNWTFRLVVVLLLIGFPIALILAWAYDVTAQGIRATKKTAAETHLRRNMIILIATGVIVSAAAGVVRLVGMSAKTQIDRYVSDSSDPTVTARTRPEKPISFNTKMLIAPAIRD